MRNQHQRGSFVLVETDEQFEDMLSISAIEIARRLVRQQNRRLHHERSRQRDALLLAAGKLDRVMIAALDEADAVEQVFGAGAGGSIEAAAELHRQNDVFKGGKCRNQVIGLEDETEFFPSKLGKLVLTQLRDVLTVDDNAARCRCIETGNQAEQSALAASRRAHDGDELSGGNVKREVANDLNFV